MSRGIANSPGAGPLCCAARFSPESAAPAAMQKSNNRHTAQTRRLVTKAFLICMGATAISATCRDTLSASLSLNTQRPCVLLPRAVVPYPVTIFLLSPAPASAYIRCVLIRLHNQGARTVKRTLAAALLFPTLPMPAALTAGSQQKEQVAKTSLKVGDTAPDFTLLSDQWKTVKLSDFHGKKNVLLAVYVLAFTGG